MGSDEMNANYSFNQFDRAIEAIGLSPFIFHQHIHLNRALSAQDIYHR